MSAFLTHLYGAANSAYQGKPWWYQRIPTIHGMCEHCERQNSIYSRLFRPMFARKLLRLYLLCHQRPQGEYVHKDEFDFEGGKGETGVMAAWGFCETREPTKNEDRPSSGYWRITPIGQAFLDLKTTVPERAMIGWGSRIDGFSGPSVSFQQCLEHRGVFSYSELMGRNLNDILKPEPKEEGLEADE